MEYSKIIAVSGLPGLYELINSKNDGAIIRSLDDKSTRFASSRVHNFSHLESIEVYTTGENVNLVEIFEAIDKAGGSLPDVKDNNIVKKYFEKVYPDLDFEKVYSSDLKKMVKWYDVLKKNNIEIKLSEPPAEEEVKEEEPKEELVVVADAPKKPVAKKAAPAPKEKAKEEKPKETKVPKEIKEEPKKKTTAVKAKKEEEPAKEKAKATKTKTTKAEKPKEEKPAKDTKKKK
ncbi:MAG: DUF5606 domain-containing protein [Bacteroidetes bacterium]|nr:DUF5606 domain-containing protein [Bacteroidota bacterium]